MTDQADDQGELSFTVTIDPSLPTYAGLLMAAAGAMVEVEDALEKARRLAVKLEQELAEASRHLRAVLDVARERGSTFAHDNASLEDADEWLNYGDE